MAVARALPGSNADSSTVVVTPQRTGRYGEAYALPMTNKEWLLADEGSYFTATAPTPGTGIIGPVSTTFSDTASGLLTIFNGNSGGGPRIYLQFIRLYVTVVSASDARVQFTLVTDNINRYTSGGTALTPKNVNQDSSNSTNATINFGALTTAAASSKRVLDHVEFRGTIDVVEDCYEMIFGSSDGSGMGGSRVATVSDMSRMVPPVVIGPGQTFILHHWAASIGTGITTIPTIGYVER